MSATAMPTSWARTNQRAESGEIEAAESEKIRPIVTAGHSVFELATDDHHDHMVDVDTNEVIEFVDDEIEARQRAIAAEQGFEIIDNSLVLYVRKKR